MKNLSNLLSENLEADLNYHILVKADLGFVVADFLDCVVVDEDLLAVNVDVLSLFDGVSNLDIVD